MASYSEVALGFAFIMSTLSGDMMLTGLAPGGINRGFAPPADTVPYIVMSHQAGRDVVTMNGIRIMGDLLFQVRAFAPADMAMTTVAASARLDTLLGGPPGRPVSGPVIVNGVQAGYVLTCYRETPIALDEIINGTEWSTFGGLYRMEIEEIAS